MCWFYETVVKILIAFLKIEIDRLFLITRIWNNQEKFGKNEFRSVTVLFYCDGQHTNSDMDIYY